MRVGYIAIFVIVNFLNAQVLAPQLRCLATSTNGDITLTWLPSSDPGSQFSSYEVFSSTSKTGPYANVGSISTLATNTFTHAGAGGNTQSRYYYVITKFGAGGSSSSSPSDTLRSIFLNLINFPGIVGVNFNHLKQPPLSTSSGSFSVLREYPAGTWTNILSTSSLSFNDTITVCTAPYNYLVTLADQSGCQSVSNKNGGVYSDKFGPTRVDIDSVSVMPNGQTVVGYPSSVSGDCSGYYLYQVINNINTKIDSVPGKNSTVYTFTTSAATGSSVVFIVAPFDSCGNVGLLNNSHETMFLQTSYDRCKYETTLNWNPYLNLKGGVLEYRIYYSVNGSAYQLVGKTTQTSFVHTGVDPSKNVSYFVRVINVPKTITSSSNRVNFFTDQTIAPDFIYIRTATVLSDSKIQLRLLVDSVKLGNGFDIYRSNDGNVFTKIAFVGSASGGNYSYEDGDVETNKQSYYYKAVAKDSCGNDRTQSNTVLSVNLKVANDKNYLFHRKLSWNNYSGFGGGLAGYSIYRIVNGTKAANPIAYTSGGANEYTDNIEEIAPLGSKIEYMVSAIEGIGNTFGIMETANSNAAITYMEADVFIPTAFAPKGVNKVWKPVTHFVDKSDYNLKIYNRWGNLLFETNDDTVGWDGNGAPNDVYVYLIEYKNSRGEYTQLKGTFTLL